MLSVKVGKAERNMTRKKERPCSNSDTSLKTGVGQLSKCKLVKFGEVAWMVEDRRAAVLAAADAVCFADRQGGDVWLAAAQLDSALLELRPALRR